MSEYLNRIGIAYLIQKLACAFKSFFSNLHALLEKTVLQLDCTSLPSAD